MSGVLLYFFLCISYFLCVFFYSPIFNFLLSFCSSPPLNVWPFFLISFLVLGVCSKFCLTGTIAILWNADLYHTMELEDTSKLYSLSSVFLWHGMDLLNKTMLLFLWRCFSHHSPMPNENCTFYPPATPYQTCFCIEIQASSTALMSLVCYRWQ